MKRTAALLLAVILVISSVVSAGAYSPLEPREQVMYDFKEFYAEQTGGEKPAFLECYELSDCPNSGFNNYYFLIRFASEDAQQGEYIKYFGNDNEYYERYYTLNKVFETGLVAFIGNPYNNKGAQSYFTLEQVAQINPDAITYIEGVVGSQYVSKINGDECNLLQVTELHHLCHKAVSVFGVNSQGEYINKPGASFISVNNLSEIDEALDEAVQLILLTDFYNHVFSANSVTSLEIQSAYDKLLDAMNSATVKKYEVEFLLEYCKSESNADGYYPTDLWQQYSDSMTRAELVLCDESATNDDYNKAYWDMLYNYNKLCTVNQLVYDIDFDSQVTVLDATRYQMMLAKLVESNSSVYYISVYNCATRIQRYLVALEDKYNGYELRELTESIEKSNIESEEWEFSAWLLNDIYCAYRLAGTC